MDRNRHLWIMGLSCLLGGAPSAVRADGLEAPTHALTLSDVALRATRDAPAVRAAELQAALATRQVEVARAAYYPTLTANGSVGPGKSWTRTDAPSPDGLGGRAPVAKSRAFGLISSAGASAEWLLTNFGGRAAEVRRAGAERTGARHFATQAHFGSVRTGAEEYVRVLTVLRLRNNAAISVERREAILAAMTKLINAGMRPRIDLQRAQIDAVAARSELSVLEATAEREQARLAAAMGLDPRTQVALAELDDAQLDVRASEQEAASSAQERRPELGAQRAKVEAAEASIGVARARRLPAVSLFARGSFDRSAFWRGTDLDQRESVVQGGVSASWSLIDIGAARGQRAARADRDAQRALLEAETLAATTNAVSSRRDVVRAERQLSQAEQVLEASRITRDGQNRRYQSGEASLIELLDAEGTEQEARSRRIDAQLELALARIAALDSLGILERRLTEAR